MKKIKTKIIKDKFQGGERYSFGISTEKITAVMGSVEIHYGIYPDGERIYIQMMNMEGRLIGQQSIKL